SPRGGGRTPTSIAQVDRNINTMSRSSGLRADSRPVLGRRGTDPAGSRLGAMDPLTAFGALAVSAMLIFYALEQRSAGFVLAFAGACVAASVYGFLQGAWPFGVIELIWAGVAARRWWSRTRTTV